MKDKRKFEIIESRQMDHLRVFHEVARALTQTLELEEVLTTIMEKMAQFFGPERWSLLLVDTIANDLYYAIAVGEDEESLRGLRIPMGEGVGGWVAQTGNPLVVPDVNLDPQWSKFSRAHPDLRIQSIACVPIRANNRSLGVIQLLNSKLDLLSEYSISFLRILCDYAAIAITNARSMTLIQELSITDDCTGLFNSRHLYTMLDEQIALGAADKQHEFSLVFVDLDHFKSVNDTHGHLRGSKLLAEVGGLLKRAIGPSCAAFRYGGDEFVALLPGYGKQAALEKTTAIWQLLRRSLFLEAEGLALNISGSFGLATYPEDGDTVHSIIKSADTMMYEVKNSTRDSVAAAHGEISGVMPSNPANASRTSSRPATMAGVDVMQRR